MDKQELQGLTAMEWAIRKYWQEKTDEQLAVGLSTTTEHVIQMRKELGLERPKGTESMKEFARRYLLSLSDLEKEAFLKQLDANEIWRMAEGNPANEQQGTGPTLVQINIGPQLDKVYGPITARVVPVDSEAIEQP